MPIVCELKYISNTQNKYVNGKILEIYFDDKYEDNSKNLFIIYGHSKIWEFCV